MYLNVSTGERIAEKTSAAHSPQMVQFFVLKRALKAIISLACNTTISFERGTNYIAKKTDANIDVVRVSFSGSKFRCDDMIWKACCWSPLRKTFSAAVN